MSGAGRPSAATGRWPNSLAAASVALAGVAGLALAVLVVFLLVGVTSGPVNWSRLMTSAVWDPSRGEFGASAMIWGTAAAAVVALAIAAPLAWGTALAVGELVPQWARRPLRAGCELLAAVPSIVYGLLGVAFIRPLVAGVADVPGGDSLLAASLVLAAMVIPTVIAVSLDALAGVPGPVREAAAACGLNRTEVIRAAVLPLARRGMGAGLVLGLARALGEAIAVFLVIGRADGRIPTSPGDVLTRLVRPGQTITTKLNGPESILAGTSGAHWAALCALGLVLLAAVAGLTAVGRRRVAQGLGVTPGHGAPGRWARARSLKGIAPRRAARDWASRAAMLGAMTITLAIALSIGGVVIARGSAALDPRFWITASAGAAGGGIRDQLVGTILLGATAGGFAAPVGLALGLVMAEYSGPRLSRWLRTLTVTLGGVPSILLGLGGYWLFSSRLDLGKSWLAGSAVLATVAVPPVAIAVAAAIASVAPARQEAALALGLRREQVVRSVLIPRAVPGLVTGLLLGLARAAGETAPLLFTATVFSGAPRFPTGVRESPVVALPTHIFVLAQDAIDPAALRSAWGAALALVMVAGVLVLAAMPIRRRYEALSAQ